MTDIVSLDEGYNTTRLIFNDKCLMLNEDNSQFNIENSTSKKGGLRTKGYFKKSFDDKPLISIITVVFNGKKYLEETIQSVINQTYSNVEYIIIDGGSTDGTLDIIKKYEDKIDYWVSEKDRGIYDAMNKGIDVASGEWLNFMNGGDEFYDNKVIENIFNDFNYLDEYVIHGKVALKYKNDLIAYYGDNKIIPHQGAFFKTNIMKFLKFNTRYKIFADGECLSRMKKLEKYKSKFIDIVFANFELGGVGNHPKYFFKRLKEEIKIKNDQKLPFSFKWYILKLIDGFGYILYHLFGEIFYYKKFQKHLVNIIGKMK